MFTALLLTSLFVADPTDPPDLIVHHAKVVTVDRDFRIAEALAVRAVLAQAASRWVTSA